MLKRFILMVAAGCAACSGGGDEDTGPIPGPDQVAFVVVDQGVGDPVTDEACDGLETQLVQDADVLGALYADLGIAAVPEIDFEEDQGLLAWVDGCTGRPVLELTSLISAPDHLIAEYKVSGTDPIGDPVAPYLLVSVERHGYATIEATVQLP